MAYNRLSNLVHLQAIMERARISAHNQNLHIEDEEVLTLTQDIEGLLALQEERVEQFMAMAVKQHPTWSWLESVKGIGPQTASLMLSYLFPPSPDKGPSAWYKAAGLYAIETAPGEYHMPRYSNLAEGQKADWHPRLRRNLYVVGTSLLKAKGFYYGHYKAMVKALMIKHPDWSDQYKPSTDKSYLDWVDRRVESDSLPDVIAAAESGFDLPGDPLEGLSQRQIEGALKLRKRKFVRTLRFRYSLEYILSICREGQAEFVLANAGRAHAVGFWKMVKLFLAHLWEVWAKTIGMQTREPYPIEILGHVKILVPLTGG